MLLTACRVSEIWKCVAAKSISLAGCCGFRSRRVKNKRPHDVPLSDMALDILRQQLVDIDRLAERMGRDAGDRVFPGRGGRGSITNQVVGKCLGRETILGKDSVKRTLGIPHWTSHDLRRSAATLMEAAGQYPLVIAYVLNHASVRTGRSPAGFMRNTPMSERSARRSTSWRGALPPLCKTMPRSFRCGKSGHELGRSRLAGCCRLPSHFLVVSRQVQTRG